MPRRYPIFQFPNPPLITAMLAGAMARTTHGPTARGAAVISALAQLVWAYREITEGANGFRRLLGVAGAARAGAELVRIARPASRPPFTGSLLPRISRRPEHGDHPRSRADRRRRWTHGLR